MEKPVQSKKEHPRIMVVYGTRPEAIKMAPIVRALQNDPRFTVTVVTTGQHREMLDQVHQDFGITPDYDLNIHRDGQTLTDITVRILQDVPPIIEREQPDAVLVQGDTSTTFASGLAAFYAGVPVIHAEAGLRTGNLRSPFPEEMNRRVTTHMSDLHLTPTSRAKQNLLHEHVHPTQIVVTGNTVIDALALVVAAKPEIEDPELQQHLAKDQPVILVTAHRRESWGEPLKAVGRAIAQIAEAFPQHTVVFPMHRNPLVRGAILPHIQDYSNVYVCEPLPYAQFCALLDRSTLIITDSGGVQEEAPFLGKPVLVMRDTTERPEGVTAGTVKLVGTDENRIVREVTRLLTDREAYLEMSRALNPYGDGKAAIRTVQALARFFGIGDDVEEFDDGLAHIDNGSVDNNGA